jgi:hypothetical protein
MMLVTGGNSHIVNASMLDQRSDFSLQRVSISGITEDLVDPGSYLSQQTTEDPVSPPPSTLPEAGVITGGILGENLIQSIIQRGNISRIISFLTSDGCIIDRIRGGDGKIATEGNLIIGTSCNDLIQGNNGDEIIFTRIGDDVVYAGRGDDIIISTVGIDRLYGGDGSDLINPGSGSNLVDGGPGDDVLLGASGSGIIAGGPGNDKIFGGTGSPIMYGGRGANHFDCPVSALGLAAGIVMDYNPSNGDTISGPCKLVNTIGSTNTESGLPSAGLPGTGETADDGSSLSSEGIIPVTP